MPLNKIDDWQRLELLTIYVVGFIEESKALSVSYGCNRNYPTVLFNKMNRKLNGQGMTEKSKRWQRAIENAKRNS